MRQRQKLQIVIEAVNSANKEIAQIKQELLSLSSEVRSVSQKIERESPFRRWTADIAHVYGSFLGLKAAFDSSIGDLVKKGIDYNKQLEVSKIGIAGIISSIAEITDEQGRQLEGQKRFAKAMEISSAAAKKLELIGMTTTAEYTELVQAFQAILAPALAANLTLEETVNLTGLITNAVKAMGLDMNQVAQEARDLLMGTIDQNSQLARTLQIKSEMIDKWKQEGTLVENITKKLQGFIQAQKVFADTLEGQISNLKDVTSKILGEGTKPLFEYLKKELQDITEQLVTIKKDTGGNIIDVQLNQEIVLQLREVSDELIHLAKSAKRAVVEIAEFTYENRELIKTAAEMIIFYKAGKWISSAALELISFSKSSWNTIAALITMEKKIAAVTNALKVFLLTSTAGRAGLIGAGLFTAYEALSYYHDKVEKQRYIDRLANEIERKYGKKVGRSLVETTIEKYGKQLTEEQIVEIIGKGLVKPIFEESNFKKLFGSPIKDVIISPKVLEKYKEENLKKLKEKIEKELDLSQVKGKPSDLGLGTDTEELNKILEDIRLKKATEGKAPWLQEIIRLSFELKELKEKFGNKLPKEIEEYYLNLIRKIYKLNYTLKKQLEEFDLTSKDKEKLETEIGDVFDTIYQKPTKEIGKQIELKKELLKADVDYYQQVLQLEGLSTTHRQQILTNYFLKLKKLRELDLQEEVKALGLKGAAARRFVQERLELLDKLYAEQQRKLLEETDETRGFYGAIRDIRDEYKKTGLIVKELTKQTIYDLENVLANTVFDVLTAKAKRLEDILFRIRDIILNTIIEIGTKKLTASILNFALPGSGTLTFEGGFSSSSGIQKYAEGGIVTKPTYALIGEAGYPEAVIPMKTGKIPVEIRSSEPKEQPVIVNLNIQAIDTQSFERYKPQIVEMVADAIRKGRMTGHIRRVI